MTDAERLRPLINEAVLLTYLGGLDKYGTSDLVVFLDDEPLPQVFLRSAWLASEVSAPVREKLQRTAMVAAGAVGIQTAFWFVARFPDGSMAAMSILSQRMQEDADA